MYVFETHLRFEVLVESDI